MTGQQAAAAESILDVVRLRGDAFNELDAGPEAAGILPAAARAAEPFAQNRARGDHPPLRFLHRTAERPDLARGAHADADERAKPVGGNGEPGALGHAIDVTDQLKAPARSTDD